MFSILIMKNFNCQTFEDENITCELCANDDGECESFTHIDDNGGEHEYIICLSCWDEMQDRIVVGKQNDFKLKNEHELVLRAYTTQVTKYIKVKNNKKTTPYLAEFSNESDGCPKTCPKTCPNCDHKLN